MPLRLLTNATLLHKDRVRAALAEFDELWCKLDAGTEPYFHVVDGTRLPFRRILDNLLLVARERPIVVQSLFLTLDGVGPDDAEIAAWVDRLARSRRRAGASTTCRSTRWPGLRRTRAAGRSTPRASRRSPPPPGRRPHRRRLRLIGGSHGRDGRPSAPRRALPRIEDVPAAADFAPGGGVHPDGTLYLIDGEVRRWTGATSEVTSPVCVVRDRQIERRRMGAHAALTKEEALDALDAAGRAWDHGRGRWPTMSVGDRIDAMLAFAAGMVSPRGVGAPADVGDRQDPRGLGEGVRPHRPVRPRHGRGLKEMDRAAGRFTASAGILAQIRRSPLGVVLCMGPFNYPLNETFTTLIPALIMGNTVVSKLPRYGMLCQPPLLPAFADAFPPGVVNIVNGDGRVVAGPIIETGDVAALAFIGTSRVANILKRQHPRPNRLRCDPRPRREEPRHRPRRRGPRPRGARVRDRRADVQRPALHGPQARSSCSGRWPSASSRSWPTRWTPCPSACRGSRASDHAPARGGQGRALQGLVEDAVAKGARVVNANGGIVNRTFYFPSVVYPVSKPMSLHSVEQFGPVVPVAPFDDVRDVIDEIIASDFGQQASSSAATRGWSGPSSTCWRTRCAA